MNPIPAHIMRVLLLTLLVSFAACAESVIVEEEEVLVSEVFEYDLGLFTEELRTSLEYTEHWENEPTEPGLYIDEIDNVFETFTDVFGCEFYTRITLHLDAVNSVAMLKRSGTPESEHCETDVIFAKIVEALEAELGAVNTIPLEGYEVKWWADHGKSTAVAMLGEDLYVIRSAEPSISKVLDIFIAVTNVEDVFGVQGVVLSTLILFTDKEDSTSQVDNQIDPKLITIGMGPDDVRAIFGDPDNESTVGIETVWTYGDYMITFIDSIEGSPAETLNE
jgi:hypothetical protein